MNATTNNQPPPRKISSTSAPGIRPPTTFAESDALRRRVQQIAVAQRFARAEQRIEAEKVRRLAEWSAASRQYMDTEREMDKLFTSTRQQVRSDHLGSLLAAAQLEIQRCVPSLQDAVQTLSSLTGTNISGASIQKVSSIKKTFTFKSLNRLITPQMQADGGRLTQLSDKITAILDEARDIQQGPIVRELRQLLDRMVLKLNGAASIMKFLSEKTISVSSDVLMAKMLKQAADEEQSAKLFGGNGDGVDNEADDKEDRENISPL